MTCKYSIRILVLFALIGLTLMNESSSSNGIVCLGEHFSLANACCHGQGYDTTKQICCNSVVHDRDPKQYTCCPLLGGGFAVLLRTICILI